MEKESDVEEGYVWICVECYRKIDPFASECWCGASGIKRHFHTSKVGEPIEASLSIVRENPPPRESARSFCTA